MALALEGEPVGSATHLGGIHSVCFLAAFLSGTDVFLFAKDLACLVVTAELCCVAEKGARCLFKP